MPGQDAVREIKNSPLSNSTINRCINDMSHDDEEILCDESTDFTSKIYVGFEVFTAVTMKDAVFWDVAFFNKIYVVAFVTFVNDGEIQGNFFCCKELPETSKAEDMLNVLSSFLETKGRSWENYVGICTDGALSMAGSVRCFTSLVKKRKS
jgi:hypothetical protein